MVVLKCSQIILMVFLLEQTLKPCCSLFGNNPQVEHVKSKIRSTQPTKRYVVVFDIDAFCSYIYLENLEFIKTSYPECPVTHHIYRMATLKSWHTYDSPYIFLPYLRILFDFLLEKGVRVVFFCCDTSRDVDVIPQLLASFWGHDKLKTLRSQGQFCLIPGEKMRRGNMSTEGSSVKDLKVVIRNGETILDSILVDDDHTFSAHDQQPCLIIMSLTLMPIVEGFDFPLNNIFYILGVFKTYFERKYEKFPLREGLKQLLPKDVEERYSWFREHPFARKMMNIGLSEVQKHVPYAMLYGLKYQDSSNRMWYDRF